MLNLLNCTGVQALVGDSLMASKANYFYLNNFSPSTILSLQTEHVDSSDWDGNSRPDKNINGKTNITPSQQLSVREELNIYNKTHAFNLLINLPEEQLDVRVNMGNNPTGWQTKVIGKYYDVIVYNQNPDVYVDVIKHIDQSNWMTTVPDSRLITQLTIPGTHDSASWHYNDVALNPFVRTQRATDNFIQQLNDGIRFFDIRVKPETDYQWALYHGSHYLGISFGRFLTDVAQWMSTHPKEAIFVSIKEDDSTAGAPANSAIFERYIRDYQNEIDWYTAGGNTIPHLGDVRGKLVLINRIKDLPGINVSAWPDDSSNVNFPANDNTYSVWLQDAYSKGGTSKANTILDFIAAHPQNNIEVSNELKFNFMSASTASCAWMPSNCAREFMPKVYFALNQNNAGASGPYAMIRYHPSGIIPLDYYDLEMVRLLAAMN